MPKWNSVYVVQLSPDATIRVAAASYKEWYSLEEGHFFSTPISAFLLSKKCPDPTVNKALRAVKYHDKLMIVAHGSVNKVADKTADELAQYLHEDCGLSEVGLITFKACYVGRGYFLHEFKNACILNNIKVGWLKGYRGATATVKNAGKPTERVRHETTKGFKTGAKRYAILEGTHPFSIGADSRYFTDVDDDA